MTQKRDDITEVVSDEMYFAANVPHVHCKAVFDFIREIPHEQLL